MEANTTEERFMELMAADFPSFRVAKCNLQHPTSDFVTAFYTTLIDAMVMLNDTQRLWALTEEQWTQIKANQGEGNSLLHHVYLRNLQSAIKYIFNQIDPKVPEFNYSDILMPENTPRRTFVFMSFMLNSYYYFINFSEELDGDMVACTEKGQEINRLEDLKSKLIEEIQNLEDQKLKYAEALKTIKADTLKFTTLNKEKESIVKELHINNDSVVKDLKKLEERESMYQEELIKLENEVRHLESLIVSNPDEAAAMHASNEMKKTECKAKMKGLEEQVGVLSSKLTRFNKVIELQQTLNSIILNVDNHSTNMMKKDFKELKKMINALNEKLSAIQSSESSITTKLINKQYLVPKLKSELAEHESHQAGIICKGEERCRLYTEHIENREKTYTEMSIKIKNDAEEVAVILSSINDLTEKCEEIEKKIKATDKEAQEKYNLYVNEIKNALGSVQQVFMT